MKKIYLIGGLNVEMRGKQTLQLAAQLPGFEIFEKNRDFDIVSDIRIWLDEDINGANYDDICVIHRCTMLDTEHIFSVYSEGYIYDMHKQDDGEHLRILYKLHSHDVFMSSSDCEANVRYALWIAYLLPAIEKQVLPIHASSIVKDWEAVLFLGESGTGKSTHTRLWLQHIENSFLLNDDSPLLRIKDDRVFVYGSPWSGKTHCYCQENVPLKAIVRLSQYPDNVIVKSNRLISIGAIQPSFPPFLAYDNLLSEKVFEIIDKIVKVTPIYGLKCRPDEQAARVAYAAIY